MESGGQGVYRGFSEESADEGNFEAAPGPPLLLPSRAAYGLSFFARVYWKKRFCHLKRVGKLPHRPALSNTWPLVTY